MPDLPPGGPGASLLIVDDMPLNLRLLSKILTRAGYRVQSAVGGLEAMATAQTASPDLILLDINMPGMDGYEVCRQLKADEQTARIPVIFVSAQGDTEDKVQAFQLGGVDYITRPFHVEEVLARVETHLTLQETQYQLQATNRQMEKHIEDLARSNQELDMLWNVSEVLNQCVTLNDTFQAGLKAISVEIGAQSGWLILLEKSGQGRLAAAYHLAKPVEMACGVDGFCPPCESLARLQVGDLKEPVIVSRCALLGPGSAAKSADELTHVSVPLRMGKNTLGALNLLVDLEPGFLERRRRVLATMADHYGAAIERARLFEQAQYLAITDGLTGMYNRRYLMALADHEVARTQRYRRQLSVIMMDVDRFKNVNDSYGHIVGDQVLTEISDRCRKNKRRVDVIGRYGGEEFLVLLPETALQQGQLVAERLRKAIADTPVETDKGPVPVTMSLGVADLDLGAHLSLEELIDRADQALYESKRKGRNRVSVWGI